VLLVMAVNAMKSKSPKADLHKESFHHEMQAGQETAMSVIWLSFMHIRDVLWESNIHERTQKY
jgi:hypothetical protein